MSAGLLGIVALCLTAAVLCVVLRQYRPEYAALLSIACGAAVVAWLAAAVGDELETLSTFFEGTLISGEMLAVVLKCLGVCILGELAAQACRDAGEGGIATKVELAAKVTLVALSLPLFKRVLSVAAALLSL